ncbi:MAG: nickel insertion protein [Planctomycetota bacterium]
MTAEAPSSPTRVVELAVNLDDATGEVVGHAVQTLLDEGALDVWTTPIQMKKQRPGVTLSVLVSADPPEAVGVTAERVIELTGSFGVRYRDWGRRVLDRRYVTLDTPIGPVPVKVGSLAGRVLVVSPEADAVAELAQKQGLAFRRAMETARAAAEAWRVEQLEIRP